MDPTSADRVVLPGERAKSIMAVEILLRMLRAASDNFPDDDLETVVIFLTVTAGSAGQAIRDPVSLRLVDNAPLPDELFRPISGRAVAASCGLPRETVRRRLDQLVAQGRMHRDERGFRVISDTMSRGGNLAFGRGLIRELETAAARLARLDAP